MNDWLQQQYSGAYNPGSNSGSNPSLPSGSHQLELNPHLPPLFFHPSFPTDHSQQTLVSSRSSTERSSRVRGSSASSTASSLDSITSSTASCSASSAATSFEHTTSLFRPGEHLTRREGSCEMGKGSSRSRERSASFWDEEKADVLSTSDGCAALTNSLGLLLLNLQDRSRVSNPESTQSYSGPTSRHSSISTDSALSYASSNSRSPSPIAESPHLQPLNIYSSTPSPLELSPPTSPRSRNIRPDEIKMPDSPLKNRRNSILSLPEPAVLPTLPPKPQRPRREKCGAPEAQFLILPLSVGAIHFNSPVMGPVMELNTFEEVECLDLYSDTMLLDVPPPYHPVRQTNYLPTPPCDSPARKRQRSS